MSLSEQLQQIDQLKTELDSLRPLPPEQVKNLAEFYEVAYTYDSNRIEGNTLTLQETSLVILKGVTVGGKSMREHLEAINHYEAITYLKELIAENAPLTERVVKEIHALVLRGIDRHNAGRYRSVNVRIAGSRHVPPDCLQVAQRMTDYMASYKAQQATQHPVMLAADMHHQFVNIHPFADGNGRTGRLVMNLILLQHGYPLANIPSEQRLTYYAHLATADQNGNREPFRSFIAENVQQSLTEYLEVIRGH